MSSLLEHGAASAALERGRMTLIARPKVEMRHGVQSFFVVLGNGSTWRRIRIGKNRLPSPFVREREWAYVDKVESSFGDLLEDLGPRTYMTKTRGLRHQAAAAVIAAGTYEIARHHEHTHLSYALDDEHDDAVLLPFNVLPARSLIAAVFNPLRKGPAVEAGLPFAEPSLFPDELQARFAGRRFAPLDPDFLDFEGAELVLIGNPAFRH